MSKREVLARYAQTSDGAIAIDVSASKVADLYSDFDRVAPYVRKDLEQNLVDYLIESARDIGARPFVIRLNLASPCDEAISRRVTESIAGYFTYLQAVERRKMQKLMRTSAILFGIGLALVVVAVWVNRAVASGGSVIGRVGAEGLTVASWVSLWEALATILIHWPSHREEIALYRHLAEAKVQINVAPSGSDAPGPPHAPA